MSLESSPGKVASSLSLTKEEINEFFERGYFRRTHVFSSEEVQVMREAFDRLLKVADSLSQTELVNGSLFVVDAKKIDRIVWCGAAEPSLLTIGEDERLTLPSSQLLGSREMEQLICQAHFKLPRDGVGFGWHQDSVHRRYGTGQWEDVNGKGSYVQTILAVDEMTAENGPLMVVPGSGKRGHLNIEDHQEWKALVNEETVESILMPPGSVLFMGPYTVHGSLPNQSDSSRRVFINGYAYPGANSRVYPGKGAGRKIVIGS